MKRSANFILKAQLPWGGPRGLRRVVCVGILVKLSLALGVEQRTTFLNISLDHTLKLVVQVLWTLGLLPQ